MSHFWYRTRVGMFRIAQSSDGRWHPWFEDEDLGSYPTAQHACDDLVGGHTHWPSCGDPSRLGLPDEISAWNRGSPDRD
ncbi:MAG: hypothetical protein RJA99_4276 [Pseudomonadota bacterium]